MINLTKDQLTFIKKTVVEPLSELGLSVYIFGSRATGNHKEFSDLDLLIKADFINQKIRNKIASIEEKLIDSSFPFKVDLVIDQDLAISYRDNIKDQIIKLNL